MIFNLFKKKNSRIPKSNDEAVFINLDAMNLSGEVYKTCDLVTLEDKINEVIQPNNLGVYDGNESGPGVTIVYLYAPDAEKLFSSIKPILETYPLCKNAKAIIRKGGPGSIQREENIIQK